MSVAKLVWVQGLEQGCGLDCRELQLWYRVRLGVRAGVCRVCELVMVKGLEQGWNCS